MARLFFAYDARDRDLARDLEKGLNSKGHQSVWGVDELVAGRGWGELMPKRLASANAVVALLTPNSEKSPSVWCEIGAARVLANSEKRTALLPVVVGLDRAPSYTHDTLILSANNSEASNKQTLIDKIDTAIKAHLAAIEAEATRFASPEDIHQPPS